MDDTEMDEVPMDAKPAILDEDEVVKRADLLDAVDGIGQYIRDYVHGELEPIKKQLQELSRIQ